MSNQRPEQVMTRVTRRANAGPPAPRSLNEPELQADRSSAVTTALRRANFMRQGVRTRLIAMAIIPLVAFIALTAAGLATFEQVRIKGSNYNEIVKSKDLVADVLPPPQYLVESYLMVLQLIQKDNPKSQAGLLTKLDQLVLEFRVRHAYWDKELKDPEIRRGMLVEAYVPAIEFISILEQKFVPAIEAGRYEEAGKIANGKLRENFLQHRVAIDKVVARSLVIQTQVEAETVRTVQRQRLILGILFGTLIAFTVALGVAIVRSILRPIVRLERVVRDDLPRVIEQARKAGFDDAEPLRVKPVVLGTNDELGRAAAAFNSVVQSAVDLASDQARQRRNTSETFIHLGRRNQKLVSQQLRHIDELERAERDPGLLKHLFRLDHLATRMRRNAESLLVLAGVEPARKWRQPIAVLDVVRSALGEVEGFERVRLQVIQPAMLPGYAIGDVTHLLAELMENALRYSPPDMPVTITSGFLESHYQIAIVDRGMGMGPRDIAAANERLKAGGTEDEIPAGSFGLYVVARLAKRYKIQVELESEGGDGMAAYISIPLSVLDAAKADRQAPARDPRVLTGARENPATRPAVGPPSRRPALALPAAQAGVTTMPAAQAGSPGPALPASPALPAEPQQPAAQAAAPELSNPPPSVAYQPAVAAPAPRFVPPTRSGQSVDAPLPADDDPLTRPSAPVSPSTWATASSGMTGPIDTTATMPVIRQPGPSESGRAVQPPQAGADGLTYTRAGLRKRSSKLGTPTPAPSTRVRPEPHADQLDSRQERPATEVRSRYDSFVAGKRRAVNSPQEPGTTSHNPQEN